MEIFFPASSLLLCCAFCACTFYIFFSFFFPGFKDWCSFLGSLLLVLLFKNRKNDLPFIVKKGRYNFVVLYSFIFLHGFCLLCCCLIMCMFCSSFFFSKFMAFIPSFYFILCLLCFFLLKNKSPILNRSCYLFLHA